MLEVKKVIDAHRDYGYLNCASAGLKQGCFVKMDGIFTADAGPTGYAGKPGYASSGSKKFSPATSGDDISTPVYPFKKYLYQAESSDLTLDTVVSGAEIVVFEAGEFETDQYSVDFSSTTVGTKLYLDASSQLTTGYDATNRVPRAIFLGQAGGFDSNYTASSMIWFRMLPQALIPSSWAQKVVA